ncbi:hypothetical protein So717_07640 [Roseobacter cerasinus]|uniref:Solute-binding protein family 3/N-terminal domain-containing protein n=1 Tax=Roseobacter cerasinus TaxID=2602289 RepID=A0A640VPK3_9RHOB|nr:transporter substrate-binding domain-containing protein [Roseobacter cerasinus]GFE49011.1 hypothetical protein So717_07640 [Roseobacter cerasinus]
MTYSLVPLYLIAFLTASSTAFASTDDVRIAMRVDTPPFVSRDPSSGAYVGYFYDVCTEAVTRAGYQFTEHPISAADRNEFLKFGSGNFDLVCDPTTITLARMNNFSDDQDIGTPPETQKSVSGAKALDFSQIIFVANGGFASVKSPQDPDWSYRLHSVTEGLSEKISGNGVLHCKDLFQQVKLAPSKPDEPAPKDQSSQNDEADHDLVEEWKLSEFIRFRYKAVEVPQDKEQEAEEVPQTRILRAQVLGYVVGSTIREAVLNFNEIGVRPIACVMPSHKDAAAAFCRGQLDRYYGDLDIVRASIAAYNTQEDETCEATFAGPDQLTYEPYAFVVSDRLAGFPERLRCAIFSMFADGTMNNLYAGRFKEEKSAPLATLFAINRVPSGQREAVDPEQPVCGAFR